MLLTHSLSSTRQAPRQPGIRGLNYANADRRKS